MGTGADSCPLDTQSPRLHQGSPSQAQLHRTHRPEPEPILSLITSQYPLTASVINGSISIYKAAQTVTPGGYWTEQHVGLPLARHTARISGVESGLRSFLQPKQDAPESSAAQQLGTPDIEKGYLDVTPQGSVYRVLSPGEQLPAYNAGDRSPPYSEQIQLSRNGPTQAWPQRLMVTTSGLGVAMSEESIQSLKYCLSWLKWANDNLGSAVAKLKDLLQQWDRRSSHASQPMSVASMTAASEDHAALAARIAQLKAEVLATLKQVVNIVSTYAGSALPENAKRLVHSHLVTLPQRFNIASSRRLSEENQQGVDQAAKNANRALILAQEGLDMMNQVQRVVNDTLVSAEDWCNRLGRRRHPADQQQLPLSQQPVIDPALSEKADDGSQMVRAEVDQTDTIMQM